MHACPHCKDAIAVTLSGVSSGKPGRVLLTPTEVTASPLLTTLDVAKRLGVDQAKVLAFIKSGTLKAINLANKGSKLKRWKIDPASLDEFLRDREREAAPTPKTKRAPKRPPFERFI